VLKHIDGLLSDWVEFHVRMLESSGIGFPSKSPLATLIDYRTRPTSRPAGAIVPLLRTTPDSVRRIDRVLQRLPQDYLDLLKQHYIDRTARRNNMHYRRLDWLHFVIEGGLLMLDS
jgi:hypothetical protein